MRISDVRLIGRVVKPLIENTLQLVYENLLPAHKLRQPLYIVGNIESIVPCTPLMKAWIRFKVFALPRVKRSIKLTVRQDRTECAVLLAVIMLISQRTVIEKTGILLVAACFFLLSFHLGILGKRLCHARKGVIGYIVLQSMRYGVIVLLAQRYIPQ